MSLLFKIGVMQGRLLPKYNGQYQAHPVENWKSEFEVAKNVGLNSIQFLYDNNSVNSNPLNDDKGNDEIILISNETNISVPSICVDYFMHNPLYSNNKNEINARLDLLRKLVASAKRIGAKDLIIPLLDKSSLDSDEKFLSFIRNIKKIKDLLQRYKVNIALETDLPINKFLELIELIESPFCTINYDIGNSSGLGYSTKEEIIAYSKKISSVHIKDRNKNNISVELGEGRAKFDIFFRHLKMIGYDGNLIMETYRDDEGLKLFKKQLKWIMPYIDNFYKN